MQCLRPLWAEKYIGSWRDVLIWVIKSEINRGLPEKGKTALRLYFLPYTSFSLEAVVLVVRLFMTLDHQPTLQ